MGSNRILEKLAAQMDQRQGARSDLFLADWQRLNKSAAKILLGYAKHLGRPSSEDLHKFMHREFGAELVPQMLSARIYPEEAGITIVVERNTPTRKFDDTGEMIKLGATMYQDPNFGGIWESKQHDDGTRFLARLVDDDIEEILKERRARMQIKYAGISLGSLKTAGRATLGVGDKVKFYSDGRIYHGTVAQLKGDLCVIAGDDGQHETTCDSIIEVTQKNQAAVEAEEDKLKDYFQRAYGFEDYAKDLVKK